MSEVIASIVLFVFLIGAVVLAAGPAPVLQGWFNVTAKPTGVLEIERTGGHCHFAGKFKSPKEVWDCYGPEGYEAVTAYYSWLQRR
jgi:hypothetical protein